jgi:hypothetical protein
MTNETVTRPRPVVCFVCSCCVASDNGAMPKGVGLKQNVETRRRMYVVSDGDGLVYYYCHN